MYLLGDNELTKFHGKCKSSLTRFTSVFSAWRTGSNKAAREALSLSLEVQRGVTAAGSRLSPRPDQCFVSKGLFIYVQSIFLSLN